MNAHKPTADQENVDGRNARRAPRWRKINQPIVDLFNFIVFLVKYYKYMI